ncbi:hypothetical protein DEU56DRAFT_901880 [Suillus clintonianus]|uniref:uncharacterized protein n=1 Tax=Suillus clintonianus TaxID=1904413 RepID=UPI001B87D37C|nr:uncharacterized protein DEU56DRAFT_901880 [Suillus clintonianus]KAG2135134.1 hypothetical protein DEU56DRAFT_901880 [Suillus clintonianus]
MSTWWSSFVCGNSIVVLRPILLSPDDSTSLVSEVSSVKTSFRVESSSWAMRVVSDVIEIRLHLETGVDKSSVVLGVVERLVQSEVKFDKSSGIVMLGVDSGTSDDENENENENENEDEKDGEDLHSGPSGAVGTVSVRFSPVDGAPISPPSIFEAVLCGDDENDGSRVVQADATIRLVEPGLGPD